MDDSKEYSHADVNSIANTQEKEMNEKLGTAADQSDMKRMGKQQKLRRNFGFFSIFGFSAILLSTWETQLG